MCPSLSKLFQNLESFYDTKIRKKYDLNCHCTRLFLFFCGGKKYKAFYVSVEYEYIMSL